MYYICLYLFNDIIFLLFNSSRCCLNCKAIPKRTCVANGHKIADYKDDIEEIGSLRSDAFAHFKSAAAKREQLAKHYRDQELYHAAKLQQNKDAAEKNKECQFKLSKKLKNCEALKRQSIVDGRHENSFCVIKEGAKKTLNEAISEEEQANLLLASATGLDLQRANS